MFRNFRLVSVALSLLLCFSAIAFGQEDTGNIEGTITDSNDAAIPGASIEVTGSSFRKTVIANEEGFFRILRMPVGLYTVKITANGFEPITKTLVRVTLGLATPLNGKLVVAGNVTEVDVDASDEAIDPTSSRIQTNLTEKELSKLPKGTNFQSALRAVPSVRPEPSAAGFSIDGATGVENTFIIDGQEVTNFRAGGLNNNNDLPFQLVRELQVKNSGFNAEFGGATGGVINVVTKSGGNEFHGEIGMDFRPNSLESGPRGILRAVDSSLSYVNNPRDNGNDTFPFASLSGPVVEDRLWFLVSGAPQFFRTERRFNYADGTSTPEYRTETRQDYYFARVDAAITDSFRLYSTFTYNPRKTNGSLPSFNTLTAAGTAAGAPDFDAQANIGGRQPASNFNLNGSYVASDNIVFSGRFSRGYLNEKISNYGVAAVTRFRCITGGTGTVGSTGETYAYNCAAGFNNVPTNFLTEKDISVRKNYEGDASFLFDDFGGRHNFKVGYQRFEVSNDVAAGYVGRGYLLFYFGRTTSAQDGTAFGNRPGEAGYVRLVDFGEFGEAGNRNEAFYVQDSWQPLNNLTLNLGLRIEREDVPSFAAGAQGISFSFADKLAPRLGFAWDVLSDGKFKIFANFGRFFDRFKYELPRGSFGGNTFNDWRAPIPSGMGDIFNLDRSYVLNNFLVFRNFRVPSNDTADFRVDPDLKPVRQTEYTVGMKYDFGNGMLLGARYTHKQIDETIEDIGYHDENGSESYFIGNPGSGICATATCGVYDVGAPAVVPERNYDALEVTLDKRFGTNFTINANYTFSRLFGNYSGLASTDEFSVNGGARDSPNVNRFFDTPFDGYTVGGEPNNGRLGTDRPHVFKFFGSYVFNNSDDSLVRLPQNNELELSTFFVGQSGTPATGRVDLIDNAYIPLTGRGSLDRLETFTQTDASLTYRYRFGRDSKFAMQFNVDVLNLFNESNVLGVYELASSHNFQPSDFEPFGVTFSHILGPNDGFRPDFDRAFFDGRITQDRINTLINTCVDTDPNTAGDQCDSVTPDARFGAPNFFQGPRTIRFGFRFTF